MTGTVVGAGDRVQHPIDAALADPWGTLGLVLGAPLHPGGTDATEALLERAGVTRKTWLLDVGCGAGDALRLARERGAHAVGLDREPRGGAIDRKPSGVVVGRPTGDVDHRGPVYGVFRGDLTRLPVRDASVDVVLSECVLCLSPDVARSLAECRRVLDAGGRLAISDVVVEGDLPDLPAPLAEALCLGDPRNRDETRDRLEDAGFEIRDVRDHRDDLLDMRDRMTDWIDYEGLLGAFGERGQRLLDAVDALDAAAEEDRLGYVSIVATSTT